MKTTFLLTAAATLALLGASHAEEGNKPAKQAKGPDPEILAKYDQDKDGKLGKEEKAAMKADKEKEKAANPKPGKKPKAIDPALLEKYDKNKDGKLCKEETAEMKKDQKAEKASMPKPEKKAKKEKKEEAPAAAPGN